MFDALPIEINGLILRFAADAFEFASKMLEFIASIITTNRATAAIVSSDDFLSDVLARFRECSQVDQSSMNIKKYVAYLRKKSSVILNCRCPCGCINIMNTYNITNVRRCHTEKELYKKCIKLCGKRYRFEMQRYQIFLGHLAPWNMFMEDIGGWVITARLVKSLSRKECTHLPQKISQVINVSL